MTDDGSFSLTRDMMEWLPADVLKFIMCGKQASFYLLLCTLSITESSQSSLNCNLTNTHVFVAKFVPQNKGVHNVW